MADQIAAILSNEGQLGNMIGAVSQLVYEILLLSVGDLCSFKAVLTRRYIWEKSS